MITHHIAEITGGPSNVFDDILSEPGSADTSTIGITPLTNLNREHSFPPLFEQEYSCAPAIYGTGIANPMGMVWSSALMQQFLGGGNAKYDLAYQNTMDAIEATLLNGTKTRDLDGKSSTIEASKAIANLLLVYCHD